MKLFISYSREDAGDFARHIHRNLMNSGHDVFIDVNNITIGDPWAHSIQQNISNCDVFLVILTPDALRSNYVENEIFQAQRENKIIVPCISEDVAYIDIKWGLDKIQGIEFINEYQLTRKLYSKIKSYENRLSGKNDKAPNLNNAESISIKSDVEDILKESEIKERGKTSNEMKAKPDVVDDYSSISEKQNLRESETIESFLERAKGLDKIGQYTKALKNYDEAIKLDPNNFDAYFNKGLLHEKMGDFEKALEVLDKGTDIDWKHKDVWYHLGKILEKLERYEEALNAFNTDLRIDNKDIKSWTNKANILVKLERHKEAIEAYDEILKLDPNDMDVKQNKELAIKELKKQEYLSLISEIKSKFQNKDYSNVIELCNQARKIDVDDILPDIYKGNSLYELKRYEEAIQSYDQVLNNEPQNPDALNKRKIVQEQLNTKLYKQKKDKELTNELNQGNVFFNQGKYQQALECFDKILNIDPNHDTAHAKKKLVLEYLSKDKDNISQGTMPKGWKPTSQSSSSDTPSYYSEDSDSLNEKGVALYNQGKYQEAIEWYVKALEMNPNKTSIKKNKEIAIQALEKRFISYVPEQINPEYSFITKWTNSNLSDGGFNTPSGIVIDSSGYVYVADSGNNRIQKFDSNGNFVTKWGTESGKLIKSGGTFNFLFGSIAVDSSSGYVYVADSGNNRIQKFHSNGNFIAKWGSRGTGDGEFDSPRDIAVDSSSGYVYVADQKNHRIQKFDSNGNFIAKWGSNGTGDGEFNYPEGIAVDSDFVYVVDTYNDRIQKFHSNGNFIAKWGSNGTGDGEFNSPKGIAVDSRGYMYVADGANDRIQKFDSNGNFITKWGSNGNGDGEFNSPKGIAVDSSGYVYVADRFNNRIQKFGLVL